jgi:hypothetical protein
MYWSVSRTARCASDGRCGPKNAPIEYCCQGCRFEPSQMLFVLGLICIGVWCLVYSSGKGKLIEALQDVNTKLDNIVDLLDRLPEVDYEARDEEALRLDH